MIVADTSFVYALLDRADSRHEEARSWYEHAVEHFVTTPLVLAETDHLALGRLGASAACAFRRDVAAGAYDIDWWPTAAAEAVEIANRYLDLGMSLTDASLVALADRVETTRIATFDERHFRAVRPLAAASAFSLLPVDASG